MIPKWIYVDPQSVAQQARTAEVRARVDAQMMRDRIENAKVQLAALTLTLPAEYRPLVGRIRNELGG